MALTVSLVKVYSIGDRKEVIADVTFDSSYTTGGLALTGTDLGLGLELNYVSSGHAIKSDNSLGVMASYDYTNSKLVAFKSNTAANPQEVANGASLATYKIRLRATGKGSAAA